MKALQRSLGHASVTMTLDTYSHSLPETMDNVLNKADALMMGKVASLEGHRKVKSESKQGESWRWELPGR